MGSSMCDERSAVVFIIGRYDRNPVKRRTPTINADTINFGEFNIGTRVMTKAKEISIARICIELYCVPQCRGESKKTAWMLLISVSLFFSVMDMKPI